MELFWYLTIGFVIIVFFILDGYDFGVGIIHLFFAREEQDKVVIAKSAGLFWDSNEVWLVAGGGMLFMAFPTFYASIFSGFYLPMMMVLWFIIFRAIGLELRSQFESRMWREIWDKAFGVSSLLLALFFGVALGNIIRGVNLGGVENGISKYEPHYFFLPLWDSSFSPQTTHPGVLDWFTLIVGVVAVIVLAMHGANWIILKTNSSINEQLKSVVYRLNFALLILTVFSVAIWHVLDPFPFAAFLDRPYFMIFPFLYLLGLIGMFFVRSFQNELYGFSFSTMLIVGGISSSLLSLFPVILPSTNTINPSLTIYNMSADGYGLSMGMRWGFVGVALIIVYFIIQKRLLKGKVDHMDYGH